MTKKGFTGTQKGMTASQRKAFEIIIGTPDEFHHGDCIGADEESHELTRYFTPDTPIIGHPPTNPSKRAFCEFDQIRPKKDYLLRNHDIVDETDELIATPGGFSEELRSGTWATIRYARKTGKPVTIIYPNGSTVREEGR
jgi:hypothetical protein